MRQRILAFTALNVFVATAHAASFLPLGFSTTELDVSYDGSVLVGNGVGGPGSAFRWTADSGMVALGSTTLAATGVSGNGSVVVGYRTTSSGWQGYRWTSSVFLDLGDLPGGFTSSAAWAISGDGNVIVGESSSGFGPQAFRWTSADGIVGLGDLAGGSFSSQAVGVSADGTVVVGWSETDDGDRAYRWTTTDGMVSLGGLGPSYFFSRASDVSDDGTVVVGWGSSDAGDQAFRWSAAGGMIGLGQIEGSFRTEALGVSGDGSVVVGVANTFTSGDQAIMWNETNGMQLLYDVLSAGGATGLTGWTLRQALAVSGDGSWVVGWGSNPSGNGEAFLANISPVPIPATVWLLGSALGVLGWIRQHGPIRRGAS